MAAREALEPANPDFFVGAKIVTNVFGEIAEGEIRIRLPEAICSRAARPCYFNGAQGIEHQGTRALRDGPDGKDKGQSRVRSSRAIRGRDNAKRAVAPAELDRCIANQEPCSILRDASPSPAIVGPQGSIRPPKRAKAPRNCAKRDRGKSFRFRESSSGSPRSRCKPLRGRRSRRRQQSCAAGAENFKHR